MLNKFPLLMLVVFQLFVFSCSTQEKKQETEEPSEKWQAVGVIYAFEEDKSTIVISHEAIPGLMGAMTMRFAVNNKEELKGLQPEDKISFVVTMGEGEYVAGNIKKVE